MEKTKKRRVWVLMGALLMALLLFFLPIGTTAEAASSGATSDDVEITSDKVTNYFLTLSLKGFEAVMVDKKFMTKRWGDFKAWSRQDKTVTILFRFDDVKYDENYKPEKPEDYTVDFSRGLSLMIERTVSLNFPGSRTAGQTISFNEDVKINIRETFYNYFKLAKEKGRNLSAMRMSIFWDGTAVQLYKGGWLSSSSYTFSIPGTFEVGEETSTDPNDSDFDMGANGGSDATPDKATGFDFWSWFLSIWGKTDPLNIFWQCLFVFAGIVVLGVIIKLFKWLFSK